jgi:hypothetical protein
MLYVLLSPPATSHFISDGLTQDSYNTWCEKNHFKSKLPKAIKAEAEADEATLRQTRLDGHLEDISHKERVVPYTDARFREAAIEWLVATDQVNKYILSHTLGVLTS